MLGFAIIFLLLIGLLPAILLGCVLAVIVHRLAAKQHMPPWRWSIPTLIPYVGIAVAGLFMLTTLFAILDRLNAVERTETFN